MAETGVDLANPRQGRLKTDDIPVALRQLQSMKGEQMQFPWLAMVAGFGSLALVGVAWVVMPSQFKEMIITHLNSTAIQSAQSPQPSTISSMPPVRLLGHYKYKEAPLDSLVPIVADGSIKLRQAAAVRFQEMMAAALDSNVVLEPLSGFRSRADQQYLFFHVKAERGQTPSERAGVSAPPGYSEHHTGYAIDIGDGNVPATNLSPDFENTAAFKWLTENAAHYSYELSFPKNNPQGVSYEPWHWRFVGDSDSLETFYTARSPQ